MVGRLSPQNAVRRERIVQILMERVPIPTSGTRAPIRTLSYLSPQEAQAQTSAISARQNARKLMAGARGELVTLARTKYTRRNKTSASE
jgi:hypothetical protein